MLVNTVMNVNLLLLEWLLEIQGRDVAKQIQPQYKRTYPHGRGIWM